MAASPTTPLGPSPRTAVRKAGDELEAVLVNEHVYSAILLSSSALDDVGGHMLRIAHANGKDLELMRKVSIPAELKVPDETLLFRQDSPHTTALKEYVVLCGGSYLRKILRSSIRTLMKRSAGVQYEIDLLRLEGSGIVAKNMASLIEATEFVLNEILSSFGSFPPGLVAFFRHLYEQVEARFPNTGYRAIGALFFLRLACPMMIGPHSTGVLRAEDSLPPALQRGLLLMTKIITNIANESASFEKEEMRPLADLVAKSIPLVRNFYDLILKSEIFGPEPGSPPLEQLVEQNTTSRARFTVMAPFLLHLTEFVHRNEDKIRAEVEARVDHTAAEALMAQLISASISLQQQRQSSIEDNPLSRSKNTRKGLLTKPPIPPSASASVIAAAAAQASTQAMAQSASKDPNCFPLGDVLMRLTANASDAAAVCAFYHSYRLFASPADVISWIVKRHSMPPPSLNTSELLRYKNDVELPQRIRLCSFVEGWVKAVPSELSDPEVATQLCAYAESLKNCGMSIQGVNLAHLLATVMQRLKQEAANASSTTSPSASPLTLSARSASTFPLLSFSSSELATEFAFMALERIRALTPATLLAVPVWTSVYTDTPVVSLIRHINAIHRYIAVSIGSATAGKQRVKLIEHLCKIASDNRKLGDWLSSTAIAYGISAGTANAKEGDKVPKPIREMIKIKKKDHAKARVPWVAPYLQRLVDQHASFLPRIVNWDKMIAIGTSVHELLAAIPSPTPVPIFQSNSSVRTFLRGELSLLLLPIGPSLASTSNSAISDSAAAANPLSESAPSISGTATSPTPSRSGSAIDLISPSGSATSLTPLTVAPVPLLRYSVNRGQSRATSLPAISALPNPNGVPRHNSQPAQPIGLPTPVGWSEALRTSGPIETRERRASSAASDGERSWDGTSDSSASAQEDTRLAADADFFDDN